MTVQSSGSDLRSCIVKDMMGGWRETLVNELQVTPRFRESSLVVTTTTNRRQREREGGQTRGEGEEEASSVICM